MKHPFLTGFLILLLCFSLNAQEIINLYPGETPNSRHGGNQTVTEINSNGLIRQVTTPTLEAFLPEKEHNSGTAVILCPGGGYSVLVYDGEGVSTARQLAEKGITAFVLKYRLPDDSLETDKKIAPLQDAQQAIKYVRENSEKWGIDKNKIGIMGFSAGGHLASTAATHYQKPYIENDSQTSLRPDFQVLVYPVISMQDKLTHADTKNKLLGSDPSKELTDQFSNEMQVTADTPPAYITHAGDDKLVDVDNSISYFEALRHQQVAAELHIYQKGDHGFIFRQTDWTEPLFRWLEANELIPDGNKIEK